ncbi:MAG: FecR family protein [Sulfurimonas sp.]|nr:FecR family protein [Sulfurimonas sp.]
MKYIVLLVSMIVSIYAKDIAFVKDVSGEVSATLNNDAFTVSPGGWLSDEMLIATKDNSSVTLIFKDNSVVILGSNSIFVLEKYVFSPAKKEYDFQVKLEKGTASFESGKIGELAPENFIFKTPEATIGIRGTKFVAKVL